MPDQTFAQTDVGPVRGTHSALAGPDSFAGAFVLGFLTGLFLKEALQPLFRRVRDARWHRTYEGTVTYDENLPASLERREPAPYPGQPRFGGTGAIGVAPATVVTPRPEEARK